jgi:hypothetical protein
VLAEQAVAVQNASTGGPEQPTSAGTSATAGLPGEAGPRPEPGTLGSKRGMLLVIGLAALPLITFAAIAVGWWLWKSDGRQEQNEVQVQVEEPPARIEPTVASEEEVEAAMQKAAEEAARRLDGEFRLAHSAKKLIEPAQLNADLIQALARGDLDAIPDSLPADLAPQSSASFRSLYDSLYAEALVYLRENVSREEYTEQAVTDAARQWEEEKRAQLKKELAETLEEHLGPSRQRR